MEEEGKNPQGVGGRKGRNSKRENQVSSNQGKCRK